MLQRRIAYVPLLFVIASISLGTGCRKAEVERPVSSSSAPADGSSRSSVDAKRSVGGGSAVASLNVAPSDALDPVWIGIDPTFMRVLSSAHPVCATRVDVDQSPDGHVDHAYRAYFPSVTDEEVESGLLEASHSMGYSPVRDRELGIGFRDERQGRSAYAKGAFVTVIERESDGVRVSALKIANLEKLETASLFETLPDAWTHVSFERIGQRVGQSNTSFEATTTLAQADRASFEAWVSKHGLSAEEHSLDPMTLTWTRKLGKGQTPGSGITVELTEGHLQVTEARGGATTGPECAQHPSREPPVSVGKVESQLPTDKSLSPQELAYLKQMEGQ